MGITADIIAYKAVVDGEITTASSPLSIAPDMVGSAFDNLADLLELYYGQTFDVLTGTGVPSPLIGADTDLYFRDNNPIEVYKKEGATWVLKATLNLGIIFPDGPLIGLQTAIDGFVVTVTSGGWTINNVIYRKSTQTQFTLSAPDANYGRYDVIYGDTSDDVLIEEGTPSISPAIPSLPANTTMFDIAFIPSVASGGQPYLLYGNNSGASIVNSLTFDQSNLVESSPGAGDWYLEFTPTAGYLPYYTDIAFADTSGYNNPGVYTRDAAGVYRQYAFTTDATQTIKIYQVKA